jgi:hypothetical protein
MAPLKPAKELWLRLTLEPVREQLGPSPQPAKARLPLRLARMLGQA